jgi:hypothetical protein
LKEKKMPMLFLPVVLVLAFFPNVRTFSVGLNIASTSMCTLIFLKAEFFVGTQLYKKFKTENL